MLYFLGMPSLSWPSACHPYTHTPRHFSMQQIKELFPCQQCFAEEDELQRTRILLLLLLAGFWDIFHQLGGLCGVRGENVSFKYNKTCRENKEHKTWKPLPNAQRRGRSRTGSFQTEEPLVPGSALSL